MASDEDDVRRSNRELQRVYRERHGEDLRKARRVATALMGLRRKRYGQGVKNTAKAITEFVTKEEMKELI